MTAIFLALAFLAKYVALIVFPFLISIILWYLFEQNSQLVEKKILRKKAFFISIGFPLISVATLGVIMFLMPAAWVDQKVFYKMLFRFKQMKEIVYMTSLDLLSENNEVNWTNVNSFMPYHIDLMKRCEQDPFFHAEGNVWNHTLLVIEKLLKDCDFLDLDYPGRFRVFLLAGKQGPGR